MKYEINVVHFKIDMALPVGIMTESAVAEADLMTLLPGRELLLSASPPVSCC